MTLQEKEVLRELARQYAALCNDEKQQEINQRMKDTNDLRIVRPVVLIEEIPWFEIDIDHELECRCTDPVALEAENFFRRALYRRRHFKADTSFEPFYSVGPSYDSTGNGVSRQEEITRTDDLNWIVSHHFTDVLEEEESAEKIHDPQFTRRADLDEEKAAVLEDAFGDILPVLRRRHGWWQYLPWDDMAFLRGVEPILYDFYDRPEYLHLLMEKFTSAAAAELEFLKKEVGFDNRDALVHCTPAYVSGLAEEGPKATWFRGTAQMFSTVSPAMHDEFEIEYIRPLAEQFAYTYYGCCEPLDNKIEIVKKIRNLRKLGVSPWANIEKCGEQIGGDYVFARKPNPANVALATDPEVIRKEIEETVKVVQKYGCPCEFVLKDISTVSYKPQNLILWADTVSKVLDEYY